MGVSIDQDRLALPPARKRRRWIIVAIAVALSGIAVVGSCAACDHVLSRLTSPEAPWESVRVLTNGEEGFTFRRRSSHPFLAEYVRFVDFDNGTSRELYPHTGGQPFINVYQYDAAKPELILLLDREGACLLNLGTQSVAEHVGIERVSTEYVEAPDRFIGRIEGYTGELRFVAASGEPEYSIPDTADPWKRNLPKQPTDGTD